MLWHAWLTWHDLITHAVCWKYCHNKHRNVLSKANNRISVVWMLKSFNMSMSIKSKELHKCTGLFLQDKLIEYLSNNSNVLILKLNMCNCERHEIFSSTSSKWFYNNSILGKCCSKQNKYFSLAVSEAELDKVLISKHWKTSAELDKMIQWPTNSAKWKPKYMKRCVLLVSQYVCHTGEGGMNTHTGERSTNQQRREKVHRYTDRWPREKPTSLLQDMYCQIF